MMQWRGGDPPHGVVAPGADRVAAAYPAQQAGQSAGHVGAFRQGTGASQWALARYLVGRAVAEAVGTTLLVLAALALVLAAVSEWAVHLSVPAVLLFVLALGIAVLRAALLGIVRRFTAIDRGGRTGAQVDALVADTGADVRRELRRVGLPSRSLTMPLIAVRMARRNRAATLTRIRQVDIDRLVPAARLDQLHLLLNEHR